MVFLLSEKYPYELTPEQLQSVTANSVEVYEDVQIR